MSENIFTEIYNKILGLFGQNAPKEEDSKDTAVNRLRLVLMQDRTNLTPEIMHRMRTELIEVLSKYVELDKEALELNFEQEGEQMALMLSIPVVRAKDEEEIQEVLKKEDEAKKASENNEVEQEAETDENGQEEADKSENETPNEEDEATEKTVVIEETTAQVLDENGEEEITELIAEELPSEKENEE